MGNADPLDVQFLARAQERRLLTSAQAASLRQELAVRRRVDPELGVHELAVERGYIDVTTAMQLLNARPSDTVADLRQRAGEPAALAPEEERFDEVPRLVEPLPNGMPPKKSGLRKSSEESHLEMELPPPTSQSGDSLFEEGSNPGLSPLPVTPRPEPIPELTNSPVLVERTPSQWDDLGSTNLGLETASQGAAQPDLAPEGNLEPMQVSPMAEDQRLGGSGDTLVDFDESASELEPQTQSMPDLARQPLPMIEDEPKAPPTPSSALNDSAVRDVMRDADDGYFGQPADLTRPAFSDAVLASAKIEEVTLFDSEKDVAKGTPEDDPSATVTDFGKTRAPGKKSASPASKAPSKPPAVTEVKDDSDADFGVTLTGDTLAPTDLKTVYDDSEAGIDDEITGEITNEPSTGSRTSGMSTALATGEVGGRKRNKVGVESNITDDQNLAGEQISASQVTLAQMREKMGLGEGVKIADGQDTAMRVVKRLKQGGGAYKRYTVIREIARGGMGKVLEVEDNDLRRSVALKVLRKEMLGRKDLVERFLEEAQITGQLEHPNIVPVHEIGVDGRGNLYFTMKLVEGEELSSVLKRLRQGDANATRSYPLSRLVEIFIKLCEGLAFAHSRGVIHRDLKPANIMVGRFGEVQIMDWGVSKIVGTREETAERTVASDRRDAHAGTTMVGAILGTPTYMSPEQARGETDTLDVQSDIFSLGVILYEILCLKLPWTGKNSEEILDQVREYDPEPPSRRAQDRAIPQELEQLAMRCLNKDPRARIQSTQDLIENLRSWQEGKTLSAVEYTMGQLVRKWLARHRKAVFAGTAIVLALMGGIVATVVVLRQARLADVPVKLKNGETLLLEAATAREAGQFAAASDKAVKAQSEFEAVLQLNDTDERAREGRQNASLEQARVQAAQEQAARDAAQKEKEAERQKSLADALKKARASRESADLALKEAQDRNRPADDTIRGQYTAALQDLLAALAIDPGNKEAGDEKLRVEKWLADYEAGRERNRQLKDLGDKLVELRARVQAARTLLVKADQFEAAKNPVLEVIRLSDLALAVPLSDEQAAKLKTEAAGAKADVTLEYARQALSQEPPKFEVCDLMLSIAEITGQRGDQVKKLRADFTEKEAAFSGFQRLLKTAEDAVGSSSWTIAVEYVAKAMKEAEASKYATARDKARLAQLWQFANLEEIHAREATATTSDQVEAILGAYEKLYRETIKDPDYVQRAEGYIAAIRSRLGVVLLEESRGTEDAVAVDYLKRALIYLVEKAHRAEAQGRLDEITARKALADLSDRLVILPRGSFIVGSLRDSDKNRQRTVEQQKILFMDRVPVTNAEFLKFVADEGYSQPRFWDEEALPLVKNFVDTTGKPGPKGWVKGGFDPSQSSLPVTGVSWYEARAYARWAKKRLPTPDEWEIAAGAPNANQPSDQGDYPFGKREDAPLIGVPRLREVGTAEWAKNALGVYDLGCNCAEWTDGAFSPGRAVVKGAETGLRPDLFLGYARRAKNSSAQLADRSAGRGFRCVQEYQPKKDG
ncbi:MAG: protein kinase [Planctomycetaceae bacterium]|nr:Serine/threonine-protein kinase PknD [Planctomycetota bacterium]NUO15206.1 protein kinase [Planctomycetaceae bacterium]